jgi:hypothetical protein
MAPPRGFRALDCRGQVVGFDHVFEDLVLVLLDFALGVRDFVLDRVVFLVGLHRHRLVAVFRQPALVDRDFLFYRAPCVLAGGELGFGAGDAFLRCAQSLFECLFALGGFRELSACLGDFGVELLESDDPLQIYMHRFRYSTCRTSAFA